MNIDIMNDSLKLAQTQLNNYKKLNKPNELWLELMKPEDVIRWFHPQTLNESMLLEKIKEALVIGSSETDDLRHQIEYLKRESLEDSDIISKLEIELEELNLKICKIRDEYSELGRDMMKQKESYEYKIQALTRQLEYKEKDITFISKQYSDLLVKSK